MNSIVVFDKNSSFNSAGISGIVTLHQCVPNDVCTIHFMLKNCKPNHTFGVHVHECGDLSNGCDSACAHFNPNKTLHGSRELYGRDRHVGDLCNNLVSNAEGIVDFTWYDDLVSLFQNKNSIIGRALVLHEKMDDLGKNRNIDKESATTGNAGKRVACAIIGITNKNFHKN
jgi:Cu-Zn family superoxide dismutase